MAGRVDDDLLAWARELVAVGEDTRAVELLTAAPVRRPGRAAARRPRPPWTAATTPDRPRRRRQAGPRQARRAATDHRFRPPRWWPTARHRPAGRAARASCRRRRVISPAGAPRSRTGPAPAPRADRRDRAGRAPPTCSPTSSRGAGPRRRAGLGRGAHRRAARSPPTTPPRGPTRCTAARSSTDRSRSRSPSRPTPRLLRETRPTRCHPPCRCDPRRTARQATPGPRPPTPHGVSAAYGRTAHADRDPDLAPAAEPGAAAPARVRPGPAVSLLGRGAGRGSG